MYLNVYKATWLVIPNEYFQGGTVGCVAKKRGCIYKLSKLSQKETLQKPEFKSSEQALGKELAQDGISYTKKSFLFV